MCGVHSVINDRANQLFGRIGRLTEGALKMTNAQFPMTEEFSMANIHTPLRSHGRVFREILARRGSPRRCRARDSWGRVRSTAACSKAPEDWRTPKPGGSAMGQRQGGSFGFGHSLVIDHRSFQL